VTVIQITAPGLDLLPRAHFRQSDFWSDRESGTGERSMGVAAGLAVLEAMSDAIVPM